jgi:hypothetical protein
MMHPLRISMAFFLLAALVCGAPWFWSWRKQRQVRRWRHQPRGTFVARRAKLFAALRRAARAPFSTGRLRG